MTARVVYVCYGKIDRSFGLFNHYFIRIPHMNLEIHPGRYEYGTHHTLGYYSKPSSILRVLTICDACVDILIQRSYRVHRWWGYFPLINCETLTKGLTFAPPISTQAVLGVGILLTAMLSIFSPALLIIAVVLFMLLLVYNNTEPSAQHTTCQHVRTLPAVS